MDTDSIVINPETGLNDKPTLYFILQGRTVWDHKTKKPIAVPAPNDVDVHFDLWPEDFIEAERVQKVQPQSDMMH